MQRSDGERQKRSDGGQSDGLQRGCRSHVMASLQRAALCFVVGHVYSTLSHCLQYRHRRRPHTRANHSPLSGKSSVSVRTFLCVFGHVFTGGEESLDSCLWFYYNDCNNCVICREGIHVGLNQQFKIWFKECRRIFSLSLKIHLFTRTITHACFCCIVPQ